MNRDQEALLLDKIKVWREASTTGSMDMRDYNRRAADALEELFGDMEDFKEILHDLVMIDCEEAAIGGGPGFKERKEKAWNRAHEVFQP